jgi:hypothetical protein
VSLPGHHRRIRHSNFIERTFGETRRVKVIGRLPGETSCLTLVWAVLDRASRGWRGLTMTSDGLRLLQDLRRSLLQPPRQLRPPTVTVAHPGVRVNFVGEQDRLVGWAGQAAGVWLCAADQIRSWGWLACWQRSVVMASASPASVRRMSVPGMLLPRGIGSWQRTRWYEDARQPVVQGRSLSGLRTAQMWVIRPPATANANTVTVTPSCWATRPGWPLTLRSRILTLPGARPASSAR